MYESTVNVVCDGIVKPFGGFWFSVASCLAVGTVAMFMALCMSTLYSRKPRPPLPPPAPKSEPYFEVLDQPLLDRRSPPPEYAQYPPEPTGLRLRRLVTGQRESCIMESKVIKQGRNDSSAYSCSCIFGNTPPTYTLEKMHGNLRKKNSAERKFGDERSGDGGKMCRSAQTQTGEANEGLQPRNAEETLHVAVKVKEEPVEIEDLRKDHAGRKDEYKKGNAGVRRILPRSTDVRAVLYDPPETTIRSALRNLSQRLMPFDQGTSLLRSVSNSTNSIRRRLFRRYRTVDQCSSQVSLE
ncbi:uncharacterized protein LOC144118744 [Amblyomma americanum]